MANFPNGLSQLDMQQVIRKQGATLPDGSVVQKVTVLTDTLVPEQYDEINLTYVTSGNGIGEIETVVYKNQTNTVATLTMTYDGSDKLSSVVRS